MLLLASYMIASYFKIPMKHFFRFIILVRMQKRFLITQVCASLCSRNVCFQNLREALTQFLLNNDTSIY
jgi:hypothetical protein